MSMIDWSAAKITAIGESAFAGSKITEIVIPEGVTTIGQRAFGDLSNDSFTISFPSTLKEAGDSLFYNTKNLKAIIWNATDFEGNFGSMDYNGVTFTDDFSVTIANGVKYIPKYFLGNSSNGPAKITLTNGLPDSIIKIGEYGFGANVVMEGTFKFPASLTYIDASAFGKSTWKVNLNEMPAGMTYIGSKAFGGAAVFTGDWSKVTISKELAESTVAPFQTNGEGITGKATLPEGVTTLGPIFRGTGVTEVTNFASSKITSIAQYAFQDCKKLTSITFPSTLTQLPNYAFRNCESITSITIPATLTKLGNYAFAGTGIMSIQIPETFDVANWGSSVLANCASLTSYNIPQSWTSLPTSFLNGTGITTFTLPSRITTIGASAFANCASLTSFTFENGGTQLTALPASLFSGCSALTSVTLPTSITTIGASLFANCTLPSITVDGEENPLVSFSNSKLYVINNKSTHKATASRLAAFVTSEANQLRYAEERGYYPSNLNAQQNSVITENEFFGVIKAQLDKSVPVPVIPEISRYWEAAKALGSSVYNGALKGDTASLQAALDKFISNLHSTL